MEGRELSPLMLFSAMRARSVRRAGHAEHVSEVMAPQRLQGSAPAVAHGKQAVIKALRAVWHLILFRRCSVVSWKKGGSVRWQETLPAGPSVAALCRSNACIVFRP